MASKSASVETMVSRSENESVAETRKTVLLGWGVQGTGEFVSIAPVLLLL